jgi:hypothetical protein
MEARGKHKVRGPVVLLGLLLLVGCEAWPSPLSLFGDDTGTITVLNAPPDGGEGGGQAFSITAKAALDPRSEADDYCYKSMRYSRLTGTQRNAGANPRDDTITWYFECVR